MSFEVGTVVPGKVTGITNFGAFVDLGERKTGLVHISEVSESYIKDIKDVLTVGDEVQVKVMSIADDGKISLSIRKAAPKSEGTADSSDYSSKKTTQPKFKDAHGPKKTSYGSYASNQKTSHYSTNSVSPSASKTDNFDALMSAFLKDSDDRLTSLKRNTEGKRGGRGGRRS